VVGILEHYVRHYVYMTDTQYQRLFGETYEPNEFLVTTIDSSDEAVSQLSESLMQMDGVNSATNIVASGRDFEKTLQAVNAAVTIIILSAAALALVVLYNLTNINITERIRELATIKVLGFYDGEVAMYIYRENIILTILGIALGQFLGKFLCEYLIRTIEIDLAMFGREAQPQNYLGSIILSLVFALLVNFMMFFRMKKIDMVESLKSVE
jgi:putative ABC transport system permease protein